MWINDEGRVFFAAKNVAQNASKNGFLGPQSGFFRGAKWLFGRLKRPFYCVLLSHMWHVPHFMKHVFLEEKNRLFRQFFFTDGRGERIRTSDLTVPNRARDQTALRPVKLELLSVS